jgi:hypothetical protein
MKKFYKKNKASTHPNITCTPWHLFKHFNKFEMNQHDRDQYASLQAPLQIPFPFTFYIHSANSISCSWKLFFSRIHCANLKDTFLHNSPCNWAINFTCYKGHLHKNLYNNLAGFCWLFFSSNQKKLCKNLYSVSYFFVILENKLGQCGHFFCLLSVVLWYILLCTARSLSLFCLFLSHLM